MGEARAGGRRVGPRAGELRGFASGRGPRPGPTLGLCGRLLRDRGDLLASRSVANSEAPLCAAVLGTRTRAAPGVGREPGTSRCGPGLPRGPQRFLNRTELPGKEGTFPGLEKDGEQTPERPRSL